MQGVGLRQVALQGRFHHPRHLRRGEVGHHRDHAPATDERGGHGGEIVAGQHDEVTRAALDHLADLLQAAAGLLDADHARQGRQPRDRGRQHVGHRPAGNVIEHHGDVDRLEDGLEMLVQPLLARLVVVRHHRQHRIGATGLGRRGQFDRLQGAVGAGAGNDRDPAGDRLHGQVDHPLVLVEIECGRLAGGPAGDQAVNAAGDLELDQVHQPLFIDPAVPHGRDESGNGALDLLHSKLRVQVADKEAKSTVRLRPAAAIIR